MILFAALLAAGQSTTIGCVVDKLGTESITRIGGRLVSAVDSSAPVETALDQDRESLIAARNECREKNKWTQEQTDIAISYVSASAALTGSEAALGREGIDAATLRGGYTGLPVGDRMTLVGGNTASAAVKAAIARLAAGSSATGAAHETVVRHVTIYFSARAALDIYPTQFAGG
jgi:sarcosine oxidase gamma subunit